ncbi:MAG: hypothetical protein ABL933_02030 [Methyloglobulus sp.]|nr:hypothetical protein [Methyloglobulus sp.]
MNKTKYILYLKTGLIAVAASLVVVASAWATPEIMAAAAAKGVKATSCTSCHTSANGTKSNLKPVLGSLPAKTYRDAWLADKTGFTKLKNVVNGTCAGGQTVNPTTFLCEAQKPNAGSVGSASTGAAATDGYTVTCGAGTANLYVRVKDLAPVLSPAISIQAKKGTKSSALSADPIDGDTSYSKPVSVVGTAGAFTVNVNKSASTAKGIENYAADIYCRNATGAKTSTKTVLTQNH